MKNKFCIVLIAVFTLMVVYACEAKTEKKAEPVKQEEVKKDESKTVKIEPLIQYVITRTHNGGYVVNVMVGNQEISRLVFDKKGLQDYLNSQLNPPVEKKEEAKPAVEKK